MTETAADTLWLADWRRQVAALYADVRSRAGSDPVAAWEHWRAERERLYRTHPQSPVPAAERAAFRARHFPYDPALRFEALAVEPAPAQPAPSDAGIPSDAGALSATGAVSAILPVSDGGAMSFTRIGRVEVPFPQGSRPLAVYWMAGYAGGLFLPFRDATNGAETYAAGRYALDAAKSADLGGDPVAGTLVVDFNFAFQPSCAFDPRWACPLAPPENRLDLPVRAGERLT
ncbi:MAG TPA: DUF1684 domain-containing protein [Candidatus Limnocylindrales bacterium]|nr:DUF1684 domain-containing protein [Candidatus Limnocylindrales bacterium]